MEVFLLLACGLALMSYAISSEFVHLLALMLPSKVVVDKGARHYVIEANLDVPRVVAIERYSCIRN